MKRRRCTSCGALFDPQTSIGRRQCAPCEEQFMAAFFGAVDASCKARDLDTVEEEA